MRGGEGKGFRWGRVEMRGAPGHRNRVEGTGAGVLGHIRRAGAHGHGSCGGYGERFVEGCSERAREVGRRQGLPKTDKGCCHGLGCSSGSTNCLSARDELRPCRGQGPAAKDESNGIGRPAV